MNTRGRPFPKDNPGRPKGARNKTTRAVESLLQGDAERIGQKCVEMALAGDATAMRLAMERIYPTRRARVQIALPPVKSVKDLPRALGAVLAAVAAGELSPDEGGVIANALSLQHRMLEACELERRIALLEQRGAAT
jgi:hypothetical protein